ncbi:LPXTG cell wall anchor domain-containing protein [Enterococcus sp. DIV0242_7C1]|uniref:LPXTG cell wall anchor domain-containing protein n=1 Tax=Enterococcus TaxID=1350 RepID=UPI001593CCBE|nr:LPXTG cell wall anchor domain-containing protein [Enterococcus sp. 9D6_DIV0238]MBO0471764.1 LPXTG cell wall anchor domain-containing protein [Enterococcus sp. DIV0242_7C1]
MRSKNILACALPIFVGIFFLTAPIHSLAAEGGQVGQDAVIEFYTDKSESEPSTSEPPKSSSESPIEKPKGRFPSTGEVVQRSLLLSGSVLIVAVFLFFALKKRKAKEGDEK